MLNKNRANDAARYLLGRLKKRNPKIQLLALELLDQAVNHCSINLNFRKQVANKSFIGTLIKLLKIKDVAPEVSI